MLTLNFNMPNMWDKHNDVVAKQNVISGFVDIV